MKAVVLAIAVLTCSAATASAQSYPNYGANPPPGADSFGQPPTGYLPPGVSRYGPSRVYPPPPNQSSYRHRRTRQVQH